MTEEFEDIMTDNLYTGNDLSYKQGGVTKAAFFIKKRYKDRNSVKYLLNRS